METVIKVRLKYQRKSGAECNFNTFDVTIFSGQQAESEKLTCLGRQGVCPLTEQGAPDIVKKHNRKFKKIIGNGFHSDSDGDIFVRRRRPLPSQETGRAKGPIAQALTRAFPILPPKRESRLQTPAVPFPLGRRLKRPDVLSVIA